ncbi:RHS repeat-associated core domain-containing protein [Limisphaera sp. VF-2]|uniref:RHS repeat-associated core domain-containing protein n=1 Tax=Limisphaera sp. VF-2 TaxID=3400418 RepID=UPI003C27EF2B
MAVDLCFQRHGDGAVRYGPFAEPLRPTGPTAKENPFRFSTKRTDNPTASALCDYRLYDPVTGRWLSRDPIHEMGGSNLYLFVCNGCLDRVEVDDRRPGAAIAIPAGL